MNYFMKMQNSEISRFMIDYAMSLEKKIIIRLSGQLFIRPDECIGSFQALLTLCLHYYSLNRLYQ